MSIRPYWKLSLFLGSKSSHTYTTYITCVALPTKKGGTMGTWLSPQKNGRMKKRGTPHPKTLPERGTLLFVDREVFDVNVVVGINPTAQQDACASTVQYSSYVHHHCCIRTAKCPTSSGTSTLLSKKPNVRMGNIPDLRTASVCFIQKEPHNIPCILNGGTQVIEACPVTTDCIVAMS